MRILLPVASIVMLASSALSARAAELKITFVGPNDTASFRAQIFRSQSDFDSGENAFAQLAVPANGKSATIAISSLPAGKYAVRVFQDIHDAGKLERNAMGIPTVPFGFSNDAFGQMGPPSFEQASLSVTDGQPLATTIHVR